MIICPNLGYAIIQLPEMIGSLCKLVKRRDSGIVSPIPKSSKVKELSLTQAKQVDFPNRSIRAHNNEKEKTHRSCKHDIQFIEFRKEISSMIESMERKMEEKISREIHTLKEDLKNETKYFSK